MARDITSGMNTELLSSILRPVVLVKLEFDSGDVLVWNGIGTLSFNGDTYLGGGDLMSVGTSAESLELKAVGLEMALSGIPSSLLSIALGEDFQERRGTVWLGALDSSYTLVVDPEPVFSGRMDTMDIKEGAETSTIILTLENRLADMQRPSERSYTDLEQQLEFPGDLGFEFVADLNDGKEIVWG